MTPQYYRRSLISAKSTDLYVTLINHTAFISYKVKKLHPKNKEKTYNNELKPLCSPLKEYR